MICGSLRCCRTTLEIPFDMERVVDSSAGVAGSISRFTTPNFGSPSAKNFIQFFTCIENPIIKVDKYGNPNPADPFSI